MQLIPYIQLAYARLATRKDATRATLHPGCTHADCYALWARLSYLGYYSGPFEDEYPKELEANVKAFQSDQNLIPDGVVGKLTWAALGKSDLSGWDEMLQPPVFHRPEIDRINSLFRLWNSLGYYSSTTPNVTSPAYLICRAGAAQLAVSWAAGRRTTHGMSCGHFGDYLAKLYLGVDDPRTRHTGMNLSCFWGQRDVGAKRRSSCGLALFDGAKTIQAQGWTPHVRGVAKCVTQEDSGYSELSVIEYGSHIICRLTVTETSGVIDPRTGLRARSGVYRVGADGCKANPGTPWTFRLWRDSDDDGIRNEFRVLQSTASSKAFEASLEVTA